MEPEQHEANVTCDKLQPIMVDVCKSPIREPNAPVQEPSSQSTSPTIQDAQLCYETQFLGFTPMSFSDEIYNALLQYSWDALEQAQLLIKKEFSTTITSEDVDSTTQDLTKKMIKCFQDAFDKLEMYLIAQIFRIRKHVVLPEDTIQEQFPNATQSLLAIDAEIKELKTKISEARITNACLKQELVDIGVVQAQLDKTLTYVDDASKIMSPEQCESLGYVCSKALQLKQLLERIEETKAPPAKVPVG